MKYYLISDNIDTLAGMRLVGVNGVVVHERNEVQHALKTAFENEEIGLVLVTEKIVSEFSDLIYEYKLKRSTPLIVEMPDRHSKQNPGESLKRYISEVVGIKI